MVTQRMAGNGRLEAIPDKANPVKFSRRGVPTAYLPAMCHGSEVPDQRGFGAAHTLMGATATAKNLFGSVYFEGIGF